MLPKISNGKEIGHNNSNIIIEGGKKKKRTDRQAYNSIDHTGDPTETNSAWNSE